MAKSKRIIINLKKEIMIEKIDNNIKEIKTSLQCIFSCAKEFCNKKGFKFTVINEWDDDYRHVTVEMKIPRDYKSIDDMLNDAKNHL